MKYILGFLSVLVFGAPLFAHGATLYIDPGQANLFRGDAITSSVRIMPDQATGECINAADIVLTYPESIQPVDVSIGRSIFSVWVEEPVINKENRTITLAGGVPNGYCGRVQGDPGLTNIIADVVFRSPGLQIGVPDNAGEAVIAFAPETQVYLNDGQGTKAPLLTLPSTLTLEKTAGPGIVDAWREAVRTDDVPPESFSIQLEQDPTGAYYIIALTTDKQTGISHYEVMEEPIDNLQAFNWGRADALWVRMENNYNHRLADQSLNSIIRVRAYDKAGNEYIATLVPDESLRSVSKSALYTYLFVAFLGVLVTIILTIVIIYLRRRSVRKRQSTDEEFHDELSDGAVDES